MRLFAFERRWIVAIFEAIIPPSACDRLPIGAADLPMGRFVDELMVHTPGRVAVGTRVALWVMVWLAPLFIARPRPFVMLRADERVALLEKLSVSDVYLLRELPQLFKMLATLGYCGAPQVQAAVGITRIDEAPPSWMRQ